VDWIPEGTVAVVTATMAFLRATNFRLVKRIIIAIRGSKTSVVTAAMLEDYASAVAAAEREADRWQRRHTSCEAEVVYSEKKIALLEHRLSVCESTDS